MVVSKVVTLVMHSERKEGDQQLKITLGLQKLQSSPVGTKAPGLHRSARACQGLPHGGVRSQAHRTQRYVDTAVVQVDAPSYLSAPVP